LINYFIYIWFLTKKTKIMDKKTLSIISYITIIGWVVAFILYGNKPEKSSLEKFHLKQSLGLGIIGIVYSIATQIVAAIVPSIAMILSLGSLVILVLWILGIINASKEEEKPLPVVGGLFVDKFSFIK
jgi:uncharacterized membrane protein